MIHFGGYNLGSCCRVITPNPDCLAMTDVNTLLNTVPAIIEKVRATRQSAVVDIWPCNSFNRCYVLKAIIKLCPPELDVSLNGEISYKG